MADRELNRRAVITILAGGMLSQALYGVLRALSLLQNRDYAIAAHGVDPLVDAALNIGLGVASLFAILLLVLSGRAAAWWVAVAVVGVGTVDAARLTVGPFAGVSYLGLLALRLAVLYVFATPLARALYGVGPGS